MKLKFLETDAKNSSKATFTTGDTKCSFKFGHFLFTCITINIQQHGFIHPLILPSLLFTFISYTISFPHQEV